MYMYVLVLVGCCHFVRKHGSGFAYVVAGNPCLCNEKMSSFRIRVYSPASNYVILFEMSVVVVPSVHVAGSEQHVRIPGPADQRASHEA